MRADAPRPRVLLLAPHFPPDHVAGAARLGSFAREFAALGHPTWVVAPGEGAASEGAAHVVRVAVAPRGRGIAGNVRHQLALRAALREGGLRALADGAAPDVVVASSPPPVAALAGVAVAGAAGVPLVLDVRDLWPDVLIEAGVASRLGPAAIVLRAVERRLLAAAALVTTPTEEKVRRLSARTGAPVRLVVNGVDAQWIEGARPYAGGGDGPFEALYAGNLGRAQDVALLARAAGSARGALRATIVGDGELAGEVAAAAAGSAGTVTLHAPEPRARVRERLASCGCAFVSLRSAELADAVPSKLLEAMALGVPVVAAVGGEAAALVRASGGGVVVEPGDEGGLEAALRAMAALGPAGRIDVGARGRAFVLSRFRREDAARALSAAIDDVVRDASRRIRGA